MPVFRFFNLLDDGADDPPPVISLTLQTAAGGRDQHVHAASQARGSDGSRPGAGVLDGTTGHETPLTPLRHPLPGHPRFKCPIGEAVQGGGVFLHSLSEPPQSLRFLRH